MQDHYPALYSHELGVIFGQQFHHRQWIENIAVKRLDIGHSPEYMRHPLREGAERDKVLDQVHTEKHTGQNLVGHIQHLVGKDEIAEKEHQGDENNGKTGRRKPSRLLPVKRSFAGCRFGF